jgi:hypothetical protein
VFGSHEKITKCKNQSLANVAGIQQRPIDVAGFQRQSLSGSGQNGRIHAGIFRINGWIRSYPAGSRPFWPDPTGIFRIRPDQWPNPVIPGRILAVLARSSLIRPDPAVLARSGCINSRIRPDPAGIWSASGRIPAQAEFRWPDSGASWIPATGCCRTPASIGFRRPTIAKF